MQLQSEQLNELMPEFIQVISELGNLTKDKQGYGYKYADLSQAIEVSRQALTNHNLAITQLVTIINAEPVLTTTLYHKSGQFIRSYYPLVQAGLSKANDAQQVGAAITYARRYALTAMLFMAQEDDDGACVGQSKEVTQKQAKPQYSNQKQTKGNAQANAQSNGKPLIERLRDGLNGCQNKKELEELYAKQMPWLQGNHPTLIDEYNQIYDERLFELTH